MTAIFRKSFMLVFIALLAGNVFAQQFITKLADSIEKKKPVGAPSGTPMLWHDPGAVESLDLVGGAGGKENAPKAPFSFIEEIMGGSTPKLEVKDANGVQWTMKFGSEVNSENFASRMAWAVGYFVEPVYFVPSGKVQGIADASFKRVKSKQLDPKTGQFLDACFERLKDEQVTKFEDEQSWHWEENPFDGSKELNGLRIMVMLLSNWDNKDARDAGRGSNTAIYQFPGEKHYLVADWGGSMGKWGGVTSREKWDCKGFADQTGDFVKGIKDGEIDFGYSGQHTSTFSKGITSADARWLIGYLGRITDAQIKLALAASGATPEETSCFTSALRQRIGMLNTLAQK